MAIELPAQTHSSFAGWDREKSIQAQPQRMTAALREQLQKGPVLAAGSFDALSARLAEHTGFRALHVTGSGVESTQLGAPDLGLMTLTELFLHVSRIAGAVNIPMICDVDTGFGGVDNVMRTVREMIRAGAAGIHIEDQVTPKRSPLLPGRVIMSREEAVGRVRAALEARTDPDFVITARSDADSISFDELVTRCNLYLEAGADAAFPMLIHYEGTPLQKLPVAEQLRVHERLVQEIDGPVMGMGFPLAGAPTIQQLVDVGIAIVIMPTTSLQAAASAMLRVLRELYSFGDISAYMSNNPDELPGGELYELLGMSRYLEYGRQFGAAAH